MKYCKPIDILNAPTLVDFIRASYGEELTKYTEPNYLIPIDPTYKFKPAIEKILNFKNKDLKIYHMLIFRQPPGNVQLMHVDFQTKHNFFTALNIPIYNCENGEMNWYTGEYVEEEIPLPGGNRYYRINEEKSSLKVDYAKIIDSPHLVMTNVPHRLFNNSDKPRVMLSIRFLNTLEMTDLDEISKIIF